jgi:hypothetical protein
MATLQERYAGFDEEWRQAELRNELHKILADTEATNTDSRRSAIINDLVTVLVKKHLPAVDSLTPRGSESENLVEFKPLIHLLNRRLYNQNWYLERYIQSAKGKTADNAQTVFFKGREDE